ncbi:MAG: class I SAM-dependent methyltransferase [Pseudomonadota bacterium]
MEAAAKGQVIRSAAEIYDEFFVPSLFEQWAAPVTEAARITTGQTVLDVACGTGALAREAKVKVGPDGAVTGLDVNEGMLAVAQAKAPEINWQSGAAEALPFDDASFDAVVSQFGLMFFEDRAAALQEMWRVLRLGGRLAVAVWDRLETSPGYAAMVALLRRLFGEEAANALYAPYCLGETGPLLELFGEAGIGNAGVDTQVGKAQFPSLQDWVRSRLR